MIDPGHDIKGGEVKTLSKDEARQGVTGHNVRYVLAFGLAGAVCAFLIVFLTFFS